MCKVSIVLPTYNRKYCLKEAIDSIMQQTYQNYELIIVDDASTDGTEELIASMQDERIRYIHLTKNVGCSEAKNAGIRESTGEYIAFQDSDTKWVAQKLEKQVRYLDSLDASVAMVYSPFQKKYQTHTLIYPALDVPLEEKSGYILRFLLEHPLVDTATMMVRKDVLTETGGFDKNMRAVDDYELSIRIAKDYKICILDEILLLSYDSEDSISNDAAVYIQNSFYLLQKHREVFEKYDMTMTYLNQLSQCALKNHQLEFYVQCLQKLTGGA